MPSQQRPWFYVAVAVQLLILAAVPAQKLLAAVVGKPVLLKVAPVDPYNILSGYYLTLGYEISGIDDNVRELEDGTVVYAVLQPARDGSWRRVDLTTAWPQQLPDGALVIKGSKRGWRIEYGIESFFVPENQRDSIASDLRQHQDQARVEVRIDARGNAVLKQLLIGVRVYGD